MVNPTPVTPIPIALSFLWAGTPQKHGPPTLGTRTQGWRTIQTGGWSPQKEISVGWLTIGSPPW
jgi:hypothetical protein